MDNCCGNSGYFPEPGVYKVMIFIFMLIMDKVVEPNKPFLKYLVRIKTKTQLILVLEAASIPEIRVLLELIGNFLEGGIPMRKDSFEALDVYGDFYEHLFYRKRYSVTLKKELILQNIGAMTVFLKAITPFINFI